MRNIVTGAFISLDGVIQAPGGPQEDTTGDFTFGGWVVPYWDDATSAAMDELFAAPFDLLLGRRTYDIFAGYWPNVPHDPKEAGYDPGNAKIGEQFDACTKYVATHRPESLAWANSRALGKDVAGALRELKKGDGPTLLTQGSSELIHQLLAHDLVDELRLLVFPIVFGRGKRLFDESSRPAAFELRRSVVSTKGVVIATYERGGSVQTGTFDTEYSVDR